MPSASRPGFSRDVTQTMALYMLPRSVYATPGQIGLGEFGSVPNDQEHGGLTVVMVARTAATSNFMAPPHRASDT